MVQTSAEISFQELVLSEILGPNTRQSSEYYRRLTIYFGHDFIIVTGLEYFAIFNFYDFYRSAKFRKS